ncbi:V-type ATP synthase subunit B [Candidatus Dependentiae bacterium]|nr:V-type ATP synthase subunit B [Candidatus Dependentiae bacterium]
MLLKEYKGITKSSGNLIVIENISGVGYDELVQIQLHDDSRRTGKVIEVTDSFAVVQVFEGTKDLNLAETKIKFFGKPFELPVSAEMLGRTFNALGKPLDDGPEILSSVKKNVNGEPINPVSRSYPKDCIQTGVSAIDILATLIRGQKLPIFSTEGLPHNMLAAQIARQANITDKANDKFAVVFGAMGIKNDTAYYFRNSFEESGAFNKVVMFLNLANDPIIERIMIPRSALTTAEFLAFEEDYHVLVILTDMTNYCEALRELSSSRGEVPSRKGFPGYLYSDLSTIYERAGRLHGKSGSITQIPILTMPNDDITHPIPDMTGYITEGQIVLSKSLFKKNIYPPVNILSSLSRLMKDGIGEGKTRDDHDKVASQLNALYSQSQEIASLVAVIGEESLNETDKIILDFSRSFEQVFINQSYSENRTIEESLNIVWELFSKLPVSLFERIPDSILKKYYKPKL